MRGHETFALFICWALLLYWTLRESSLFLSLSLCGEI